MTRSRWHAWRDSNPRHPVPKTDKYRHKSPYLGTELVQVRPAKSTLIRTGCCQRCCQKAGTNALVLLSNPFGAELCEMLTEICQGKAETDRVFGMTKSSLGVKIHKWAVKAGVNLHTHSFRHYFATKLVERGANIRVVQELLGHSSLATSQVYLSVTADHLEDAIGLLD